MLKRWLSLAHAHPLVTAAWKQLLEVAKEQGDFGLMDFDHEDIVAWNRYKRGRETLRALLEEIYPQVRDMIRAEWAAAYGQTLGPPDSADRIGSRPTRDWTTQMFMRFDLPNAIGADRFQVQFVGDREELLFTAEGRWGGDATELTDYQKEQPNLNRVIEWLREHDFTEQGAYYGNYWTNPHPVSGWLRENPADTREALVELARADFRTLLESELFTTLPTDDIPTNPKESRD